MSARKVARSSCNSDLEMVASSVLPFSAGSILPRLGALSSRAAAVEAAEVPREEDMRARGKRTKVPNGRKPKTYERGPREGLLSEP
eukprot:3549146-Heterocapsa_arctica.AAC.1